MNREQKADLTMKLDAIFLLAFFVCLEIYLLFSVDVSGTFLVIIPKTEWTYNVVISMLTGEVVSQVDHTRDILEMFVLAVICLTLALFCFIRMFLYDISQVYKNYQENKANTYLQQTKEILQE